MKDLEQEVLAYLTERKWHQLRPGDLAKSVSIEAGELLELFQWDNPSLAETKQDAKRMEKIRKELADVLIYCLDMAVLLELDTAAIVRAKLEDVRKKYPAELFRDRDMSKDAGTEETYLEIKQEHRKNAEV